MMATQIFKRVGFDVVKILALASALFALQGCAQTTPLREIYPGQTAVGTLNVDTQSRLDIRTNMQFAPAGYVFTKNGGTILADNTYQRSETYTGTTELWKLNTEYLVEPTAVAILVQGAGFIPAVALFVDASERDVRKGSGTGIALPEYSGAQNAVAGAYLLQPQGNYFLAVQAQGIPVEAGYQVVVQTMEK